MILSCFTLNRADPLVRTEESDLVRLHVRVVDASQGLPCPPRVLWAHPKPGVLLIQAGAPVSPWGFPRGYLATEVRHVDVGARLAGLAGGDRVRFAVVANPTQCPGWKPRDPVTGVRARRGSRRVLPVGVRDEWLCRRLAGAVSVEQLSGERLGCRVGRKPDRLVSQEHHAWSGEGVVVDPDRLRVLVADGLSAGKAYGLGLLLVRRAG